MVTRGRRWVAIILCFGIPVAIVFTAWRDDTPAAGVDPLLPPKCVAVRQQATTDPAGAADAAKKIVADPSATIEERSCARAQFDATAPAIPNECVVAAEAAKRGDLERARSSYDSLLRADVDDVTKSCAVGGSSRLPPRRTFTDWSFDQANRVTKWATSWLPGEPLVLADSTKSIVAAIAWFVTVGLLLVGFRQLLRWRRERSINSIVIQKIDAPKSNDAATNLAEVMRDRLAKAGVLPGQLHGSLSDIAVDVTDVFGTAGETGRFGQLVDGIKSALSISTGYTVTAVADGDPSNAAEPCRVTVQLDEAATGRTLCIDAFHGKDHETAAIKAAYAVYRRLTDEPEVKRRTPSCWRWTDAGALQLYYEAQQDYESCSYLAAVEKLDRAAAAEPNNSLIDLALNDNHLALSRPLPSDDALRSGDAETGTHLLLALWHAARAVRAQGRTYLAHDQLALTLTNALQLAAAWPNDDDKRDRIRAILPGTPAPDASPAEASRSFTDLANREWRLALRRAKLPYMWWGALWLSQRRMYAGDLWLFRRHRHSVQDLLRANHVGTQYDRMTERSGWRLAYAAARLWRVRLGALGFLRRTPELESTVRYNVAAAYARKARWLAENGDRPREFDDAVDACVRSLERSFTGTGRQMSADDLVFLECDHDFDPVHGTAAYDKWLARYRSRFDPPASAIAVWKGVYVDIAQRADMAAMTWADNLSRPAGPRRVWNDDTQKWSARAVSWFSDDLDRWKALRDWTGNLAATGKRNAFTASVSMPALDAGLDSRPYEPVVPSGADATAIRAANLATVPALQDHIADSIEVTEWLLTIAILLAMQHDAADLATAVRDGGAALIERWQAVARWALDPTHA